MTDILLSIHAFCYGLNDCQRFKGKSTLMWGLTNLGARFAIWVLYVWKMIQNLFGISANSSGLLCDEMVVSLTTYPPRIKIVWLTIDSLIRQTILPKELVMHLSLKDFPEAEKDLPRSLLRYKRNGLKICWHEENLKSHKKYIYAFQEHPEKCVITVDDDLYYRKDMLERLWRLHKQFPRCVCANTTREIPNDADIPYKKWNLVFNQSCSPSHKLIGIGCGGILYPVKLFGSSQYADKEMIRLTSLSTDDLWLKAQELLAGIKVVTGNYYCHAPSLVGSQHNALSKGNWQQKSQNDINWKNLRNSFPQIDQILYSRIYK